MTSRLASDETLDDSVRPSSAEDLPPSIVRALVRLTSDDRPTATFELDPDPESVTDARHFTTATLENWGLAALSDDVALVVSELVTNALRHSLPPRLSEAPGRILLRLQHETSFILCGVLDTGSEAPRRRVPDFIAETGRGLHIVESFSATWGWMPLDGGGKVVWALFQPVG
ncbi:MAG: putative anti-sigma regulatory factor, serine/threonine protein kinase [Actinomycetia bacterium]|nr:putative anti-sigma regulatory factor, serine/threonine protein kinase [Actinomycetes bacterium]